MTHCRALCKSPPGFAQPVQYDCRRNAVISVRCDWGHIIQSCCIFWIICLTSCFCYWFIVTKTLELTWRNYQLFLPKYSKSIHHLHTGMFTVNDWKSNMYDVIRHQLFLLFLCSFWKQKAQETETLSLTEHEKCSCEQSTCSCGCYQTVKIHSMIICPVATVKESNYRKNINSPPVYKQ